jgi:hypothetical protein
MRHMVWLLLPLALGAQSTEGDPRVLQALVAEMQQLRMAIERSTLLNTRTQVALTQLQIQDTALARLTQQYNDVRNKNAELNVRRSRSAEELKDLEQKQTAPDLPPELHHQLEMQIKDLKLEVETSAASYQQRSSLESDLALQVQQAQAQIADSHNRIADMEHMLDAAIQQLLKQK